MALKFRKKLMFCCLFLCALWCAEAAAMAENVTITPVVTEIGENRVVYPQVDGMQDEAIQQAVNDDIILQSEVARHLITLGTLREGGWGLVADYEVYLENDILSVTMHAKGTMPDKREGQTYTALCYDLQTGEKITPDMLFANQAEAETYMGEVLESTLWDELSSYLENTNITPVPMDHFALDADGITFYYPSSQFSLLSGYSGAVQFYYEELETYLNWEGILGRLNVRPEMLNDVEAKAKIAETVEKGALPHIPVTIGDPMTDVVAKYRLVREPDQYPGGKYYQLEAPAFRQVLVLSDALSNGYEDSQVLGVQTARACLYGIRAGETTRERWREILGEPESTVEFSQSMAYDYGLPQGESDFYTFGSHQLRLHADEDGILYSVRLSK